jgi:single-strand DNA-binding protein
MLNQTVIVGRLVSDPTIKENENGTKVVKALLAVQRSYKNTEGEYETDFIDCTIWNGMAQNMSDYCKKGDILGIKGRLETSNYEKNGEKRKSMTIVAEKVTFLTSGKDKVQNQENDKELDD